MKTTILFFLVFSLAGVISVPARAQKPCDPVIVEGVVKNKADNKPVPNAFMRMNVRVGGHSARTDKDGRFQLCLDTLKKWEWGVVSLDGRFQPTTVQVEVTTDKEKKVTLPDVYLTPVDEVKQGLTLYVREGYVYDEASGKPLHDALVTANGAVLCRTDPRGYFAVVQMSSLPLVYQKEGFAPQMKMISFGPEDAPAIHIKMSPTP
jgi:hypothetical protein